MDAPGPADDIRLLARAADRYDSLAEVADLMDDGRGAERFRSIAADCRGQAMALLDATVEPRSPTVRSEPD